MGGVVRSDGMYVLWRSGLRRFIDAEVYDRLGSVLLKRSEARLHDEMVLRHRIAPAIEAIAK
jgi:hypothetical protein